jgi:UDP-2,3-diacylglucosamine hydrolase
MPADPAAVPARVPALARVALRAPVLISDLHLCAARPRGVQALLELLARQTGTGHELVILGDLFEFWAGDDTLAQDGPDDAVSRAVAQGLRSLAGSGCAVYLMHGNRDLLLGSGFLQASGARLLADPCRATLGEGAQAVEALLAHGDAYCTLDLPYMAFRRQARDERFQAAFLARPLEERRALLGQARARSEAGKQQMAAEIMDVTPAAVEAALRAAGTALLIHGHTHRPARHELTIDGRAALRWVLTDWELETAPARGGGLRWVDGALQAFSVAGGAAA